MKNWLGFRKQDIGNGLGDAHKVRNQLLGGDAKLSQPSVPFSQAELAGCDIRYAIVFSMLSPFAGYSYTGRFRVMGIFLASSVAVFIGMSCMLSEQVVQSKRVQIVVGLSIGAIAAADNSGAILLARRAIQRTK